MQLVPLLLLHAVIIDLFTAKDLDFLLANIESGVFSLECLRLHLTFSLLFESHQMIPDLMNTDLAVYIRAG